MVLCENSLEKNCHSSAFLNRGLFLIGVQHDASRIQYVEVENVKSNHLVSNVVYLKVLFNPLLFLIYVNEIPNCLEKANIRTFADDFTPFYSSNYLQDLEKNYK